MAPASAPTGGDAGVGTGDGEGKGRGKGKGHKKKKDKDAGKGAETGGMPESGGGGGKDLGEVEVHGRVIGRAELRTEAGMLATSDLSLQSARAEVRWEWHDWLRAVVEVELAGVEVKDAYVRAKWRWLGGRAGNFKPPVSAVEMESRWTLPASERGLVNDVLVDKMGIAGRRPGMQLELTGGGFWDPKLRVGIFEGSHARSDDPNDDRLFRALLDEYALGAERLAARASVKPWGVEVGAFFEWRAVEPVRGDGFSRFWCAGADASWDETLGPTAVRLWADGFAGSNWQDDNPFDGDGDTFLAARLIAAWRWGGLEKGAPYGEPYVMMEVVDPEATIGDDVLWEVSGGVNAGAWDRVRVTLELQQRHYSRNVPLSLGLFDGVILAPPYDRTALLLQVGAAF
ncbi:MAG TPA: hypothetical protein VG389_17270 [Myxococcota bacterium]|nr:hypothetical protein [Myxococcota bacterium]